MFKCWVSEWQCTTQGLSHYLEHMLFMGSKKYPDENEYDSYLTKHGGSSNAFTELVRSLATCTYLKSATSNVAVATIHNVCADN